MASQTLNPIKKLKMSITTKKGDQGKTALYGGQRVSKNDPRIHALGVLDELNAQLGLAISLFANSALKPALKRPAGNSHKGRKKNQTVPNKNYIPLLTNIQRELLVIGAHISTPTSTSTDATPVAASATTPHTTSSTTTKKVSLHLPVFDARALKKIEQTITALEKKLPPLHNFILPGGAPTAAALHVARTVCRRAERNVVALAEQLATKTEARPVVLPAILQYLNRLSDLLFLLARTVNDNKK